MYHKLKSDSRWADNILYTQFQSEKKEAVNSYTCSQFQDLAADLAADCADCVCFVCAFDGNPSLLSCSDLQKNPPMERNTRKG